MVDFDSKIAVLYAALLGVLPAATPAWAQREFRWPGGARAAVALTYDDGTDIHLDHAMPDLEAVHLRGTFFISGNSRSLAARPEEWRAAARRGHELANHSLFHPCLLDKPPEHRAFVTPEFALENYTVRRMIQELQVMNTLLYGLDSHRSRTYAYPCHDDVAGGESFVDALRPLFAAARIGGSKAPVDLRTLDLHRVPSVGASRTTAARLIERVNQAAEAGALVIFCFHGVGGGHSINLDREEHRQLLGWLVRNRETIWTAPFIDVMQHVIAERQRLGWETRTSGRAPSGSR